MSLYVCLIIPNLYIIFRFLFIQLDQFLKKQPLALVLKLEPTYFFVYAKQISFTPVCSSGHVLNEMACEP